MKEIGKMINKKEKEYIILRMVIEKWEIIIMVNKLESMLNFILMEIFLLDTLINVK